MAERVGRACLLLPPSQDELRHATNLIDRALASERAKPSWLQPYFRFAKALAEYRAGHLEGALTLLDATTQQILGAGTTPVARDGRAPPRQGRTPHAPAFARRSPFTPGM